MSRVAIVGSCITRDLWPIRGNAAELLYISRTSFPSVFSAPLQGVEAAAEPPPPLRQHQHRALVADLQKTALASLAAFQPTHLIFDFIDERFDLLSVRGALATHSWELEASGYLDQAALADRRTIPRISSGCDRLWREAAGQFAAVVRATPLRHARLILHTARWADHKQSGDGSLSPVENVEILPGRGADIAEHNAMLERYERWFTDLMPPMHRVEAAQVRLADEHHRWGLSPFHYIPDYYDEIWRQLEALGVKRRG